MENTHDIDIQATAPLTLDAIYTDKLFEPRTLRQPHWRKDGKQFSFLDAVPDAEGMQQTPQSSEPGANVPAQPLATLWIFDVERKQRAPIIAAETLRVGDETLTIHGYLWSPDETRVLLARPPQAHAPEFDKELWMYTLATHALTCVARANAGEDDFPQREMVAGRPEPGLCKGG